MPLSVKVEKGTFNAALHKLIASKPTPLTKMKAKAPKAARTKH